MKKIYLLFLAATAVIAFQSCDKSDSDDSQEGSETTNWWYRTGVVSGGIKSISDGYTTENFDDKGRLTSTVSPYSNTQYEYNSSGLISRIAELDPSDVDKVLEERIFEYGNPGKFIPNLMGPGHMFHINETGLIPGLSKIKYKYATGNNNCEVDFKFEGDNLLAILSYPGFPNCDTTIVKYQGDYPYEYSNGWEFIGPITYYSNGMFKEYREGFISSGEVSTDRRYYYMESNKYMLLEKFTEKIEGTSSTTYTYDDKGNPVSSVYTFPTGKVGSVTNYSYEFDSKGNWIKRSSTFQDGEGQETGPGIVETREISYWN